MSKMSQRNVATILTSFLMCRWLIFEKLGYYGFVSVNLLEAGRANL